MQAEVQCNVRKRTGLPVKYGGLEAQHPLAKSSGLYHLKLSSSLAIPGYERCGASERPTALYTTHTRLSLTSSLHATHGPRRSRRSSLLTHQATCENQHPITIFSLAL
eukprot:1018388-Pleurochrysis_carterae.AAC.4